MKYLWYIPNQASPGHRGDDTQDGWGSLDYASSLAQETELHGWDGGLIGTGWGRSDAFVLGTALAARTSSFQPLIAARPGYWDPAQFALAATTLDQLSGGRLLVNIVSGLDHLDAYGDHVTDPVNRYDRTREFLEIVRLLWSQDEVTFHGQHFSVDNAAMTPQTYGYPDHHPVLYFGGASDPAERVAATHADVQLFWGEALEDIAGRIIRLRVLGTILERDLPPLEYGLRITVVARETSSEAWRVAEAKVAAMKGKADVGAKVDSTSSRARSLPLFNPSTSIGQRRLIDLAARGDVLDSCLYTAPGKVGGEGAGTTWLVGSYDEVAYALGRYRALGITHFILSDTPYQQEAARIGDHVLARLRAQESTALRSDKTTP